MTQAAEDHAADSLRYLVMGDQYGQGAGPTWSGSDIGLDGMVGGWSGRSGRNRAPFGFDGWP